MGDDALDSSDDESSAPGYDFESAFAELEAENKRLSGCVYESTENVGAQPSHEHAARDTIAERRPADPPGVVPDRAAVNGNAEYDEDFDEEAFFREDDEDKAEDAPVVGRDQDWKRLSGAAYDESNVADDSEGSGSEGILDRGIGTPNGGQESRRGLAETENDITVNIKPISEHLQREYRPISPSHYVWKVLGKAKRRYRRRDKWYTVEYDDGRVEQLPVSEICAKENGKEALERFRSPPARDEMAKIVFKKRRVSHDSTYDNFGGPDYTSLDELDRMDVDEDEDEDEDEDVYEAGPHSFPHRPRLKERTSSVLSSRRSTRQASTRHVSSDRAEELEDQNPPGRRQLRTRPAHSDRPRYSLVDNDVDELAADSDNDVFIVQSDIAPAKTGKRKRGRQARTYREASIEFEVRRSGRANKSSKSMAEAMGDGDDDFFAVDDRPAGAPKVIGVKEVFQQVEDMDFKNAHSGTCGTCGINGYSSNKGILIYCQGCSFAYHKTCLGYRAQREHRATKIGSDSFVLQCKYCIGSYKKTNELAPNHDACMVCREKGPSCAEFSPRLTARAEEKIRNNNDGVDPVVGVPASLINNAKNVFFRCNKCNRACHPEHLPPMDGSLPVVGESRDTLRARRLADYSIDWSCKDCLDMVERVQSIVAWRLVKDHTSAAAAREESTFDSVPEDDKEYLVKWANKSYAHCEWKAGAWIWGVVPATTRNKFARGDGDTQPSAIREGDELFPAEFLYADIVFAVKYRPGERAVSRADGLAKISKVAQFKAKFQSLGYDDVVWDDPPPKSDAQRWSSFRQAYEEYLNGKFFNAAPVQAITDRIRDFRAEEYREIDVQPRGLAPGCELMKYQVQGVNWLVYNFYKMVNVVLADEMGLGKTIQVCAFIAALMERPKCWPFLIVVPNATCSNWRREIKKWVPSVRVVAYHGGRVAQELAFRDELFPDGRGDMKAHVVVMSYDSAQDDHTHLQFKQVRWRGLIVDEGQRLKNDQSLLYLALRRLNVPFRLLLTGTPLQNNKRELFNLIQFIDNRQDAAKLDAEYAELNKDNIPKLHALIKPYFLRRTKADVLKFLPPMSQIIVPVTMSVVQERLCKSIMAKNPELIRAIFAKSRISKKESGSLNNILMQLRKCLCHPFVYSRAVEEENLDDETMRKNFVEASSKLVLLKMMLPKLKEKGHRVLMFTQFLDQLLIFEDFLTDMGYEYRRLDGSMSSLQKQKWIDEFNAKDSKVFAFLLSTRAGGVGINLASADTVIICDPDFNPHQDLQAISRAHRIGQKNKVLCIQLMTKGTVEEKIVEIGRKKMALDHVLIETMDNEDILGNDLESVLKHGAEALFDESSKRDAIRYDDAAIEKLLDRSQIVGPSLDAEDIEQREFTLARVWAHESGGFVDDLELQENDGAMSRGAWEAILKQREEDALKRARMEQTQLGRGGRRRQAVQYAQDDNEGAGVNANDSEQDGDFVHNGAESAEDDSEGDGDEADADVVTEAPSHKAAAKNPAAKQGPVANSAAPQPRTTAFDSQAAVLDVQAQQRQQRRTYPSSITSTTPVPLPAYVVPGAGFNPRAGIQINLDPVGSSGARANGHSQPVSSTAAAGAAGAGALSLAGALGARVASPGSVAARRGQQQQSRRAPSGVVTPLGSQPRLCTRCALVHDPAMACPESVVQLRLAIDALRSSSVPNSIQSKAALQNKLREAAIHGSSRKGTL